MRQKGDTCICCGGTGEVFGYAQHSEDFEHLTCAACDGRGIAGGGRTVVAVKGSNGEAIRLAIAALDEAIQKSKQVREAR